MAKSIKKRVTRIGPKHRLWITLEQDTFETLQARGEKLGYSISALVQRVVLRGVTAGLIDDPNPTLNEELSQLQAEYIEILKDSGDIKEQLIAQLHRQIAQQHRRICEYEEAIHGPYKGDQAWRDAQARVTDGDEV